jgi:hypothetical protein
MYVFDYLFLMALAKEEFAAKLQAQTINVTNHLLLIRYYTGNESMDHWIRGVHASIPRLPFLKGIGKAKLPSFGFLYQNLWAWLGDNRVGIWEEFIDEVSEDDSLSMDDLPDGMTEEDHKWMDGVFKDICQALAESKGGRLTEGQYFEIILKD